MQGSKEVQGLLNWYSTVLGKTFLEAEKKALKAVYEKYKPKQVLICSELDLSPCDHSVFQVQCGQSVGASGVGVHIETPQSLPFQNACFDLVVLHHTLELDGAERIFEEACRTLSSGGALVVVGFNPWSLWGGWRLICRLYIDSPWNRAWKSISGLHHWLENASLSLCEKETFFWRLPTSKTQWLKLFEPFEPIPWREYGAGYLLAAIKKNVVMPDREATCCDYSVIA